MINEPEIEEVNVPLVDAYEHAYAVLDEYNLEYTEKNWAIYIQHPEKEWQAYQYFPTTNRWASMTNHRNKLRKHYQCASVRNLIEEYILK